MSLVGSFQPGALCDCTTLQDAKIPTSSASSKVGAAPVLLLLTPRSSLLGSVGFWDSRACPHVVGSPVLVLWKGNQPPPPSLLHSTFLHWGSTAKYRSLFPSSPPLLSQHRELRKHSGTEHIKGENNNAATNPGSGGERDHSGQALSYATHAP